MTDGSRKLVLWIKHVSEVLNILKVAMNIINVSIMLDILDFNMSVRRQDMLLFYL